MLVWQCSRCKTTAEPGGDGIDGPPDGWALRNLPVRGSEGARSDISWALCPVCDDSLYAWMYQ